VSSDGNRIAGGCFGDVSEERTKEKGRRQKEFFLLLPSPFFLLPSPFFLS
jgi:hypothetical protein